MTILLVWSERARDGCVGVLIDEGDMGVPISIRLDDDVRDELETQAKARGIVLATLERDDRRRNRRRSESRDQTKR